MTFACSYVVSCVLIAAHQSGKRFRVVVVDSSPLMEGKEFLKRMTGVGIQCSYVLLNAVCYMMKSVTKVLVGAYALLSNGNLVSRVGTAAVAMAAHEWSVPVIVCSETIKFSEKTLLDSITWNELGNADDLAVTESGRKPNVLANWRDVPHLTLLSLLYDVTPMDFITMVITEFGMIPPTSVPVILREEYGNKKERN
jgi:translation initiation factor eIF-2B subunit delta